jgi:hypothetical protein
MVGECDGRGRAAEVDCDCAGLPLRPNSSGVPGLGDGRREGCPICGFVEDMEDCAEGPAGEARGEDACVSRAGDDMGGVGYLNRVSSGCIDDGLANGSDMP